jgi:hypothetical protein
VKSEHGHVPARTGELAAAVNHPNQGRFPALRLFELPAVDVHAVQAAQIEVVGNQRLDELAGQPHGVERPRRAVSTSRSNSPHQYRAGLVGHRERQRQLVEPVSAKA